MTSKPSSRSASRKKSTMIPGVVHEGQVSSLINLAARLTSKAARIRLGTFGAWPGQIPLLLWIAEKDGMIQKELVERASMEQSSVAEHLDRMEREGMLYRKRGPDDKRKYRIYLTDKGRTMSLKIVKHMDSGAKIYTSGISETDLQVFDRVIRQIILQLSEYCRIYGSKTRPVGKAASSKKADGGTPERHKVRSSL